MRSTLLAAAALTAMGVAAARADIPIATAGPMTGQYAAFGDQMKHGAEQAVKDINARGGVLGQKLRLVIGDDACDPKQAVAIANKFASDGVKPAMVATFKEAGYDPEGYTLYTYAAIQVWAEAATKANSADAAKVESLIRGQTFNTVIGQLTFDGKGDIQDPEYVRYTWHDGKYVELE